MYWTPARLLTIAVVITLISIDGVYRAWRQRADDRLDPRLFTTYVTVLLIGDGLAWLGFFVEWLD